MPIHIDQNLIDALAQRQIAYEDSTQRTEAPSTLTPSLLAVLGAAADGASTYNFMRKGTVHEDNAMYGPLKNSPLATSLSVAGTGLVGAILANKVLGKKFPKLADALVANQGANQIGLAGRNISREPHVSSAASYNTSITDAIRRMHQK